MTRLVIGSRGSALALWQANWAKETLLQHHADLVVEVEVIRTQGDRLADAPLSDIGGKEVWTKEIELALLSGQIDLAVHSLKDLPTQLPDGLVLGSVSPREDVRDALVSADGKTFAALPGGAKVATSSLRRQAQLKYARPDLHFQAIRGNVDTRLHKLKTEGYDALVLAAAGLKRLGFADRITELIDPVLCLPAPGQAALGIEVRKGDARVARFVSVLNDGAAHRAVTAERAMLEVLEGGCRVPIGGWARLDSGRLKLSGIVADPDGKVLVKAEMDGAPDKPWVLGQKVAEKLLAQGAKDILDQLV